MLWPSLPLTFSSPIFFHSTRKLHFRLFLFSELSCTVLLFVFIFLSLLRLDLPLCQQMANGCQSFKLQLKQYLPETSGTPKQKSSLFLLLLYDYIMFIKSLLHMPDIVLTATSQGVVTVPVLEMIKQVQRNYTTRPLLHNKQHNTLSFPLLQHLTCLTWYFVYGNKLLYYIDPSSGVK